ncbi:hypothetical protein M885DRAFT_520105 [Pelagophyceae sp. CCMP2097]|nr:hypothetical protein M885DRAFT_520105 [Pelagophyceae sp. CCMP2097]
MAAMGRGAAWLLLVVVGDAATYVPSVGYVPLKSSAGKSIAGSASTTAAGASRPSSRETDVKMSEHGKTILACIGDSITWGGFDEEYDYLSYPTQLRNLLDTDKYQVLNYGGRGATATINGDEWTLNYADLYADSLAAGASAYFFMFGTNDAKDGFYNETNYVKDYLALMDEFAALPQHPAIVVMVPPPFLSSEGLSRKWGDWATSPINTRFVDLIPEMALQRGWTVVDHWTPLNEDLIDDFGVLRPLDKISEELYRDRIHPNGGGLSVMAYNIFRQLGDILNVPLSYMPTQAPTYSPTASPPPSSLPFPKPTGKPTYAPSYSPQPTHAPTHKPSHAPSYSPSYFPSTSAPSYLPTSKPTHAPTYRPTYVPTPLPSTSTPSYMPSSSPSSQPSMIPTPRPTTAVPSSAPSSTPSSLPSPMPSLVPTLALRSSFGTAVLRDLEGPTFGADERKAFEAAVAKVLGVASSSVSIAQVDFFDDSGRRLRASNANAHVEFDVQARVRFGDVEGALGAAVESGAFDAALHETGAATALKAAKSFQVFITRSRPPTSAPTSLPSSSPSSAPTEVPKDDSEDPANLGFFASVGAAVAALLVLCVGGCYFCFTRRRNAEYVRSETPSKAMPFAALAASLRAAAAAGDAKTEVFDASRDSRPGSSPVYRPDAYEDPKPRRVDADRPNKDPPPRRVDEDPPPRRVDVFVDARPSDGDGAKAGSWSGSHEAVEALLAEAARDLPDFEEDDGLPHCDAPPDAGDAPGASRSSLDVAMEALMNGTGRGSMNSTGRGSLGAAPPSERPAASQAPATQYSEVPDVQADARGEPLPAPGAGASAEPLSWLQAVRLKAERQKSDESEAAAMAAAPPPPPPPRIETSPRDDASPRADAWTGASPRFERDRKSSQWADIDADSDEFAAAAARGEASPRFERRGSQFADIDADTGDSFSMQSQRPSAAHTADDVAADDFAADDVADNFAASDFESAVAAKRAYFAADVPFAADVAAHVSFAADLADVAAHDADFAADVPFATSVAGLHADFDDIDDADADDDAADDSQWL